MKSDPLIQMLTVVLGLSALASVGLYFLYMSDTRELRTMQGQISFIANRHAAFNALVADCLEYSKRNQEIDPLLEAFGFKGARTAAAPAAKPGQK